MAINSMQDAIEFIKARGHEIGASYKSGCPKAKEVINSYALLERCPGDGMAQLFLMNALTDWDTEYN